MEITEFSSIIASFNFLGLILRDKSKVIANISKRGSSPYPN